MGPTLPAIRGQDQVAEDAERGGKKKEGREREGEWRSAEVKGVEVYVHVP